MKLYSIDVSTEDCTDDPNSEILTKSYLERRLEMRDEKTDLFEKRYKLKITPYHLMTADDDWRVLRKTLDRAAQLKVTKLLESYQKGDWTTAQSIIRSLKLMRVSDKPIEVIQKFIQDECKGVPPPNWKGYRKFDALR
jgi:hypothetical protein